MNKPHTDLTKRVRRPKGPKAISRNMAASKGVLAAVGCAECFQPDGTREQ